MCGIDVVASGLDEMGRGGQRWCRMLRVSGGFKIWPTSVIYIFVCCGTQRCGSLVDATNNSQYLLEVELQGSSQIHNIYMPS